MLPRLDLTALDSGQGLWISLVGARGRGAHTAWPGCRWGQTSGRLTVRSSHRLVGMFTELASLTGSVAVGSVVATHPFIHPWPSSAARGQCSAWHRGNFGTEQWPEFMRSRAPVSHLTLWGW